MLRGNVMSIEVGTFACYVEGFRRKPRSYSSFEARQLKVGKNGLGKDATSLKWCTPTLVLSKGFIITSDLKIN